MAVSVINPQRPQDPLERVANAIQIARSVYGIYSDSKGLESEKQKREDLLKQTGIENVRADKELEYKKAAMLQNQQDAAINRKAKLLEIQKTQKELDEGPKPTGDQSKAALFAKRMQQAEDIFGSLQSAGDTGSSLKNSIQRLEYFPSGFQSESFKKRDQAERNYINAVLRRESGAAISPSEFESAAIQYFPRNGDTPDVLAQKAENRRLAIQGLSAEAGDNALNRIDSRMASGSAPSKVTAGGIPIDEKDIQAKAKEILLKRSMNAKR